MAASNAKKLLEVSNLSMEFGGLRAIDNVSLDIFEGEIVALIGPNGAGKTTFFNCVTGIYTPTHGQVTIHPPTGKSRKLNGMKPNSITALGMARTFQNIRLFPAMTVLENVMIGCHCRTSTSILDAILSTPKAKREEKETVERAYRLLEKVGLADVADEFSSNLSYGAQRRLEIARALATDPFLLLLDEPAAGMNPQETHELDALIMRIRNEEKVSILLIEHDMKLVMSISDRIYVVEYGKEIAQGTPREIKENKRVIEAYLGEETHA
jgi:branched-chain amino acid transport system ATP-binding protein